MTTETAFTVRLTAASMGEMEYNLEHADASTGPHEAGLIVVRDQIAAADRAADGSVTIVLTDRNVILALLDEAGYQAEYLLTEAEEFPDHEDAVSMRSTAGDLFVVVRSCEKALGR